MLQATPGIHLTLTCSVCGTPASDGARPCPSCGELLEFTLVASAVEGDLAARFRARRTSDAPIDQSGVWRFRELLPSIPQDAVVTLGENRAPLYSSRTGAAYAKSERLAYLHLGSNPTGSFKDAGMTVAVSNAKARGATMVVCASTGNTAASMAAYAARAGMRALVIVPATGISESKVAQTLDYGAKVLAIEGDFDAALALVRELDPARAEIVNSVNPYRIEGQKCALFALLEQRAWNPPDWIVIPGGNLGNSSAFGKALREAKQLGLIDRVPRIAVVQAAGAAPFVRSFATGADLVPVKADTTATAIKIGAPASWRKATREVKASGGVVVSVSDAEIADARAIIGIDGVGCEPASAATLAALRHLVASKTIGASDDVVLVLTGHVLKDGAFSAAYHASGAQYANHITRVPAGVEPHRLLELAEN